jgi:hypothetical protein
MSDHTIPGGPSFPCYRDRDRHGECAICDRIDRTGPLYSEAYRRRFFPEEFPADPPAQAQGPAIVSTGVARSIDIPLAGDVVAAIAARVGADRLAKWWEAKTGLPCGCEERRGKLNRATESLLRFAGLRR